MVNLSSSNLKIRNIYIWCHLTFTIFTIHHSPFNGLQWAMVVEWNEGSRKKGNVWTKIEPYCGVWRILNCFGLSNHLSSLIVIIVLMKIHIRLFRTVSQQPIYEGSPNKILCILQLSSTKNYTVFFILSLSFLVCLVHKRVLCISHIFCPKNTAFES